MPRGRRAYPLEFRQRIVELVRVGRRPGELAREFEPTVESINRWVKQADRDEGRVADGLTTQEREEMRRLRRENRQLKREREILAKAAAWFAREAGSTHQRIRVREGAPSPLSGSHTVSPAGRLHQWVLRVATAWHVGARAEADWELLSMIQAIHAGSHGTYGAPRIHAELGAQGVRVGRKRVARLMHSVALAGVSRRKRPHTTVRSRGTAKAPDLVQRQFTAEAPDRLWVADITYVPTGAGFLYLAVVVDVFSRRVVGWAMESHIRTELVLQTLNMALYLRRPQGVIHHSDQGIQYTAYAFGKLCREWSVRPSMGSVGDCYDNALCESFFASLECELLDRRFFQTHAEARMAVFQYIEGWYNTHRRHSSIGYHAPIAFERRYTSTIQQVETPTVH